MTPHIGGVLKCYRVRGDRLELVHTRRGYSTHRIGSRNLRTSLLVDLEGDGRQELVLPTQDQRYLSLIARTAAGETSKGLLPSGAFPKADKIGQANKEAK